MRELSIYHEPFEEEEREYIQRRLAKNIKGIKGFLFFAIIGAVAIPSLFALILSLSYSFADEKFKEGNPPPNIILLAFVTMLFILFIIGVAYLIIRKQSVQGFKQDLKFNYKIVERTIIASKRYMSLNQSYHFYLDSPTKLSIEVSAHDYELYQQGDEINIEYTPFTKTYFGYH